MGKFSLFSYLRLKCDKSNLLAKSSYKKFYDENIHLISNYIQLRKYDSTGDAFSLIKTCIVLEGLINKNHIESEVELYKEANLKKREINVLIHNRLSFFKYNREIIYVPFFSKVINNAYSNDLPLLLKKPYSNLKDDFDDMIVNPFTTYGYHVFDSLFTNLVLIKISPNKKLAAFYSIELEMIFVITDQGTLEEQINLFDTKMIERRKSHLFDHLNKIMDDYFNFRKNDFIDHLYQCHFISLKTLQYIKNKEVNDDF